MVTITAEKAKELIPALDALTGFAWMYGPVDYAGEQMGVYCIRPSDSNGKASTDVLETLDIQCTRRLKLAKGFGVKIALSPGIAPEKIESILQKAEVATAEGTTRQPDKREESTQHFLDKVELAWARSLVAELFPEITWNAFEATTDEFRKFHPPCLLGVIRTDLGSRRLSEISDKFAAMGITPSVVNRYLDVSEMPCYQGVDVPTGNEILLDKFHGAALSNLQKAVQLKHSQDRPSPVVEQAQLAPDMGLGTSAFRG